MHGYTTKLMDLLINHIGYELTSIYINSLTTVIKYQISKKQMKSIKERYKIWQRSGKLKNNFFNGKTISGTKSQRKFTIRKCSYNSLLTKLLYI